MEKNLKEVVLSALLVGTIIASCSTPKSIDQKAVDPEGQTCSQAAGQIADNFEAQKKAGFIDLSATVLSKTQVNEDYMKCLVKEIQEKVGSNYTVSYASNGNMWRYQIKENKAN